MYTVIKLWIEMYMYQNGMTASCCRQSGMHDTLYCYVDESAKVQVNVQADLSLSLSLALFSPVLPLNFSLNLSSKLWYNY